ncbi:hypothetical protein GGTG_01519 [Gaeumannomyces tritici R3-111a-1]|uniref:Uncharacterized protein n=1 Tax=Gaeumannomyces tritici (strain R3-111a-1) TaxID=644352 RepID=J3NJT8_GAET3|nr:hypothetical protein GGTG_01519 [Gaeumannomyces tritici R3-111a-1]EJT81541.1 hypothetical protein GGTG_01519 [Gaeumannomyces tritici R3-111a-1]
MQDKLSYFPIRPLGSAQHAAWPMPLQAFCSVVWVGDAIEIYLPARLSSCLTPGTVVATGSWAKEDVPFDNGAPNVDINRSLWL